MLSSFYLVQCLLNGFTVVRNNLSYNRFVILIFDEMKIREDLVYDKTGVYVHGFVNLGSVNEQLLKLEKDLSSDKPPLELATHMLTLMVRGVFIKLEFPYASFPTTGTLCCVLNVVIAFCFVHFSYTGITGECLYWIIWEAVRRLEECELKV